MRAVSKFLALAFTAAIIQPAMADPAPTTLNFDDLAAPGFLTSQYANSKGVVFSGAAYGVTASMQGCTPGSGFFFSHGCGAVLLSSDPFDDDPNLPLNGIDKMKVTFAAGFDTFSFMYSGNSGDTLLSIDIYDADNNLLGHSSTFSTNGNCGTSGLNWCNWSTPLPANVPLSGYGGRATSVVFTAKEQTILLDNMSFTPAAAASGPLPEPASMALVLGALGALGWTRKRSAR